MTISYHDLALYIVSILVSCNIFLLGFIFSFLELVFLLFKPCNSLGIFFQKFSNTHWFSFHYSVSWYQSRNTSKIFFLLSLPPSFCIDITPQSISFSFSLSSHIKTQKLSVSRIAIHCQPSPISDNLPRSPTVLVDDYPLSDDPHQRSSDHIRPPVTSVQTSQILIEPSRSRSDITNHHRRLPIFRRPSPMFLRLRWTSGDLAIDQAGHF